MRVKFANVLLENTEQSLSNPTLYYRATAPVVFNRDVGYWELWGPGRFDFTTWFNAISVMKLDTYTAAKGYIFHMEVKGAACTFVQTRADTYTDIAEPIEGTQLSLEASDDWQSIDVAMQPDEKAIVAGFLMTAEGSVFIRNGAYYFDMDEEDVIETEFVLATTTYKKEDFIIPNIGLIKKEIIDSDEPISKHFNMYVIDNGKTLDVEALSSEHVIIRPNNNVGGAGGFARGMIEALEQTPKATRILLMDDDVAVSPESIKRTYNLVSVLNEDYRDAFISGAMLNLEVPEDRWEDLGFMSPDGRFYPIKVQLRMTQLRDIVDNEHYVPSEEQKNQMYAAWWFCCIPISLIEKNGLPLPFFVRCDDAEYGIRCNPEFISMNGICIWHQPFHSRYSAAVERYQTSRNTMIAQATTGMAPNSDFLWEIRNNVHLELKKFNYVNAELVLDGFEDFMKGPEFIMSPVAEECFMRANKKAEKLIPFKELRPMVESLDEDIDFDELDRMEVYRDRPRSRSEAFEDYVTFNGQRVPYFGKDRHIAIIPAEGWLYPAGELHGTDTIVAIDTFNKRGIIRYKDDKRWREVWSRYKRDVKEYKKIKPQLDAAYAACRDEITSVAFWKKYLGMDTEA